MTISAAMVMQLRERTGAGMMECKKFLTAANGDIELAITEMRKAGQAKADKKADRTAAEGVIVVARSNDGKHAFMMEINSETDFVARDDNFTSFAQGAVNAAMAHNATEIEKIAGLTMPGSQDSVEVARQQLVAKIGENIQLRRAATLSAETVVGTYLHGSRIGVVVAMKGGDETLAKDIAMHIAASRPQVVRPEEVSPEAIAHEREIFSAQAKDSGKPADIIAKMVDGRINKFIAEVSLMGQPFVKNPDLKVSDLLKQKQAEITGFVCYEVGEGIEKKKDDFVKEVMEQARGH